MKITAHGYTHHDPLIAPDPACIIPGLTREEYDSLVLARSDLWWTPVPTKEWWEQPTRATRRIGVALVVTVFLLILAVAGAVEGRADTPDTPRRVILAAEWRAWQSMGEEAQTRYCQMYRGYAEYVWLDGMAESAYWNESPRKLEWVAQRVLARGCGEWVR